MSSPWRIALIRFRQRLQLIIAAVRNLWLIVSFALLMVCGLLTVGYVRTGDEGRALLQRWALSAGLYLTAPGSTKIERTQQLAEWGDAVAQHNLGVMYEHGRGVPQDYRQAMAWYRRAARQGRASAQHNLGYRGGPLQRQLPSAEHQNTYAESRDALAKPRTSQEIAEAQKRASEWQAAFEASSPD